MNQGHFYRADDVVCNKKNQFLILPNPFLKNNHGLEDSSIHVKTKRYHYSSTIMYPIMVNRTIMQQSLEFPPSLYTDIKRVFKPKRCKGRKIQ